MTHFGFPALAVALALLPLVAAAGPFGIDMGAPRDSLDSADAGSKIRLDSVPAPHPLFADYSVWLTGQEGVCRILAVSRPYENDAYGLDIRADFDRVVAALQAKYGPGNELQSLRTGALWDEPRDWVMAIRQSERLHAHDWSSVAAGEEAYSLIQLWVEALSASDAVMILEYRATTFADCAERIEGAADSVF